jgi:hypothetical protein
VYKNKSLFYREGITTRQEMYNDSTKHDDSNIVLDTDSIFVNIKDIVKTDDVTRETNDVTRETNDVTRVTNDVIVMDLSKKLQVLSTFLNGQKELYLMSRNIMNFRQNTILVLCVLVGSIATILSTKECDNNAIFIVTILNSFITVLIGVAGIFKFDVQGENYFNISNMYGRMEIHIENMTSQIQIIENPEECFTNQIKTIEENIMNILDNNSYVIPNMLVPVFPIISGIHIFKVIQMNNMYYIDKGGVSDIENDGSSVIPLCDLDEEMFEEIKHAGSHHWMYFIVFVPKKPDMYYELQRLHLL